LPSITQLSGTLAMNSRTLSCSSSEVASVQFGPMWMNRIELEVRDVQSLC
jgi:hypothetical protein